MRKIASSLISVILLATLPFTCGTNVTLGQKAKTTKTPSGDGKLAVKASIDGPEGLAIDGRGNIYVANSQESRVRRIDAQTQVITTVAGNGKDAFNGDGGLAVDASLEYPKAIAFDGEDNLYIAGIGGRIRKVDVNTHIISTLAGNGRMEITGTGDGGPAINASFRGTHDLAFDGVHSLFIDDDLDHRIRKVDLQTRIITTVAGGGSELGDGGLAVNAGLRFPMGIAFDSSHNFFIADSEHNRIRRVDAITKIITTVAGNGINASSGDGGPAVNASLNYPSGMAVDANGDLYFVEGAKDRVRRIDGRTGIISTFAGTGKKGFSGDGGPANLAKLDNPASVMSDRTGNIYIPEFANNRIRRVDARTSIITTFAGNGLPPRNTVFL